MLHRLCTYFDVHFLPRGLALYDSLVRHWPDVELWTLCLDDASAELLRRLALPRVQLVTLADLERYDPSLPAVRDTRSRLGYFFTCTPILPRYVLAQAPDAAAVFYLDADLFFFSDPRPVLEELATGSILIHEHSAAMRAHPHGTFNVGLVGFRRDEQGLACLDLWRQRCLEWCDEWEGPEGRFGDQKYLEEWPGRFSRCVIARAPGIGCGPWNLDERRLDATRDGRLQVDGEPLVFYHFHGVRGLGPDALGIAYATFDRAIAPAVRSAIYAPYVRAVHDAARRVRDLGAPEVIAFGRGVRSGGGGRVSRRRLAQRALGLANLLRGAFESRVILVVGERVF